MLDTDEATTQDPSRTPKIRNPQSAIRNPAMALMLLVFGVYALTMSGHTYSPDEETLLALSRSVVEQGSWAMTPTTGLFQVTGVDGRRYSEKGPGQSLAAVPWTATGLIVGNLFGGEQAGFALRFIVGTFNALIGAGIAGVFAALCMALGYARRTSLFLGGTLAFATFLWPTTRTFFAEPLVTLCLLASFYLMFRAFPYFTNRSIESRQAKVRLLLSGLLFAAAVAVKVQAAIALPAILLYLVWRVRWTRDEGRGTRATQYTSRFTLVLVWAAGLGLGLAPLLLYNWSFFGGPFSTGYGYGTGPQNFNTPLYEGLYGLLLSPGKGLLWYALPLLISIAGFTGFRRRHRAEAMFIIVLASSMLAVFGSFYAWHGDGAWGPRLITPIVPFLLLPALVVIQRATAQKPQAVSQLDYVNTKNTKMLLGFGVETRIDERRKTKSYLRPDGRSLLISIAVGLGFIVNLLGVLVNFDTFLNVGYGAQTRYWMPYASPILGHASLLDQQMRGSLLRMSPQPRTVLLKSGFSYSEGNKARGKFLPRWTTGMGVLEVWPDLGGGPVTATLRLLDHRPPEMARAKVTLRVNDMPVELEKAPVPDIPIGTDYSFAVSTYPARIAIESDTWNPSSLQDGARDEDIGVNLESIKISEGGVLRQYTVVEAFAAPPYYPQPLWYYDLRTSFPADIWPVYLAEADMGNKGILLLALPLVVIGLASLLIGWRSLLRQ